MSNAWPYPFRPRLLRVLRGDRTQQELAEMAGVSQGSISAAERGLSAPSILEALAAALDFKEAPERLLDFVEFEPKRVVQPTQIIRTED